MRFFVTGMLMVEYFYHKVIDLKDPSSGIQDIRYIDPLKIRLIRKARKNWTK